jgi:hypothetical protein
VTTSMSCSGRDDAVAGDLLRRHPATRRGARWPVIGTAWRGHTRTRDRRALSGACRAGAAFNHRSDAGSTSVRSAAVGEQIKSHAYSYPSHLSRRTQSCCGAAAIEHLLPANRSRLSAVSRSAASWR